jgi:hypothetical protein
MTKLLLLLLLSLAARARPSESQTHQHPPGLQNQVNTSAQGTQQSPVFVRIAQSKQEAADAKAERERQWHSTWWSVWLTGIIAFIGLIQTIVFSIQASRLKETIRKMDQIATDQTRDIQASIAEASRSAGAMETVARSLVQNAESVRIGLDINRKIAERQKLITELQGRSYLSVSFFVMVHQNPTTGVRFEPKMNVSNSGGTPANEVRFFITADVVPFPLRDDFSYSGPTQNTTYSSLIGPGLTRVISAVVPKIYPEEEDRQIRSGIGQRIIVWGIVTYKDSFDTERYTQFGSTFAMISDTHWIATDTPKHNECN